MKRYKAGILIACAVLACCAPNALQAQDTPVTGVSWVPARPIQGTLFRVRVHAGSDAAPSGKIGNEPLHFSKATSGEWEALAAAPLDGGNDAALRVVVTADAKADTVRMSVPI